MLAGFVQLEVYWMMEGQCSQTGSVPVSWWNSFVKIVLTEMYGSWLSP